MVSLMSPVQFASAVRSPMLDLYELLLALDPARFQQEARPKLREGLASVRDRLSDIVGRVEGVELADETRTIVSVLKDKLPNTDGAKELWMTLREELSLAYEAVVAALRSHSVSVPSLRPTNYVRNFFHVGNGLIVLLMLRFMPEKALLWTATSAFLFVWTLEGTRRISEEWNNRLMKIFGAVAHPGEHYKVNSGTMYVSALFALAWLREPTASAIGVAVLALADPAASIIGRRFGKTKLIHGRSLEGTLTFALVGAAAAIGAVYFFHPAAPFFMTLGLAALGGVAGAITELLSGRIDDNFSIPVVTALSCAGLIHAVAMQLPSL